jgi:hypothetical protein
MRGQHMYSYQCTAAAVATVDSSAPQSGRLLLHHLVVSVATWQVWVRVVHSVCRDCWTPIKSWWFDVGKAACAYRLM